MRSNVVHGLALCVTLAACQQARETPAADASPTIVSAIPGSLAPFGDGYPDAGDPCRALGESPATADFLDHTARLVGCPTAEAAKALGGEIVSTVDGITIVSIPDAEARAAMERNGPPPPPDGDDDALVAGTDYNATADVKCGFAGQPATGSCSAGVKRDWNGPDTALVEVTKPDGFKRAIFFKGTNAFGADSAQADGSAAYDFNVTRNGDQSTIRFGPETYVIVDALIEGG